MDLGKSKEVELKVKYSYVKQFYHSLSSLDFRDDTLNKTLTMVLNALDNPTAPTEDSIFGLIGQCYDNCVRVNIPSEMIEPMKVLFKKLDEAVYNISKEKQYLKDFAKTEAYKQKDEIFQQGLEAGRNLLVQLNSGGLTLDQLNEKINYSENPVENDNH